MSKITFHEVNGTIIKVTDSRHLSTSWKPGDNPDHRVWGNVGVHIIVPAVSDEQKYEPAQEIYLYQCTQIQRYIDILTAAIAPHPFNSESDPH